MRTLTLTTLSVVLLLGLLEAATTPASAVPFGKIATSSDPPTRASSILENVGWRRGYGGYGYDGGYYPYRYSYGGYYPSYRYSYGGYYPSYRYSYGSYYPSYRYSNGSYCPPYGYYPSYGYYGGRRW